MRCYKSSRGGIFLQYQDFSYNSIDENVPWRLYINTPWVISYGTKLKKRLAQSGFKIDLNPSKTCRYVPAEKVSSKGVHRGRISHRPRWTLATDEKVNRYEAIDAYIIEEIKRILETTYPTLEISLILYLGLTPVWVGLLYGIYHLVKMIGAKAGARWSSKKMKDDDTEKDIPLKTMGAKDNDDDDLEVGEDEVTVQINDLGIQEDAMAQPRQFV
jgi:hypothetical protein